MSHSGANIFQGPLYLERFEMRSRFGFGVLELLFNSFQYLTIVMQIKDRILV